MWQPQGYYTQYLLRTPPLLFGKEAVRGLYTYPGERVAVIYGSSVIDKGIEIFNAVFKKKTVAFFSRSWKGEPTIQGLSETIVNLEKFKPDVIIAVGGGSVIDGTKLCRLFYEFPFFDLEHSRIDGSELKTKFIAIPSTIGSGAEISSAAVYWDEMLKKKQMVVVHELQPDVIVYDVNYIKNTPKRILYASVLDGLSHIIEGYVSNINNSVADVFGEKGLLIFHEIMSELLDENVDDLTEKKLERLQYAGYLGGIVQNHCIVGAAHAIAHQLTGYGYSHGEAVGLLLPTVIMKNMNDSVVAERYEELTSKTGFKNVDDLVSFLNRLLLTSEIENRRSELKTLLTKLEQDDTFVKNVIDDRGGKGNPVLITREFIGTIIRSI